MKVDSFAPTGASVAAVLSCVQSPLLLMTSTVPILGFSQIQMSFVSDTSGHVAPHAMTTIPVVEQANRQEGSKLDWHVPSSISRAGHKKRVRESLARHMQALAVSMPGLSSEGHKEALPIFYYAL